MKTKIKPLRDIWIGVDSGSDTALLCALKAGRSTPLPSKAFVVIQVDKGGAIMIKNVLLAYHC